MFTASDIGTFFNYFIIYTIGFILGAYGGLFSEASGIINIALEGSMVFGAFGGILFLQIMNKALAGSFLVSTYSGLILLVLMAIIVVIICSLLFSFLLSFVSIKLKANQTIVGTALNYLAVAICTLINTAYLKIDKKEVETSMFSSILKGVSDNAFINSVLDNLNFSIVIGIIVIIILWVLMNKTRFGLRLRACGENPSACASVGIRVNKMRYEGTAIGSISAGIAGFIMFSCLPLGSWTITAYGYGFLVLAIEIFGNWKATNIIFCSLLFSFFFAFGPTFTAALSNGYYPINDTIFGTRAFYSLLPYLIALISLIIFSKKSRAPKAEGIPFDKSVR